MDNSEALFILSFLFILLSLIVLMRFFLIKNSASASFIFHKRAKRLDGSKFLSIGFSVSYFLQCLNLINYMIT